jgi:hypothetical protein
LVGLAVEILTHPLLAWLVAVTILIVPVLLAELSLLAKLIQHAVPVVPAVHHAVDIGHLSGLP